LEQRKVDGKGEWEMKGQNEEGKINKKKGKYGV